MRSLFPPRPAAPASHEAPRPARTQPSRPARFQFIALPLLLLIGLTSGCSIKSIAADSLADALAGSGDVFAADNDPQLIEDASPFALKLMESVLAETPRHRGLLEAAARGFTQYAYAFVGQQADEVETRDIAAATLLRDRARRLLLRARDYGLRGLDVAHPGFPQRLAANPKAAVAALSRRDVGLAYWTAAALGAAISISKDNPELIADQPIVEALIDRALVLEEAFDHGAIHAFLISYETARPGAGANGPVAAKRHFDRAVALGAGAGALVAYAEGVLIQAQDRRGFEALLKQAIAINPDAQPSQRLVTLIMQRRAKWLLSRVDELFLE